MKSRLSVATAVAVVLGTAAEVRAEVPDQVAGIVNYKRLNAKLAAGGTLSTEALRDLKAMMDEPRTLIRSLVRSFAHGVDEAHAAPYLKRIGLEHPHTPKEMILQHLLVMELEDHGYLRSL